MSAADAPLDLHRTPLPPPPAWRPTAVLAGHALFTALHTILLANVIWLMPMLARLRFGAGDWQTTLITAAVSTFMMASIFWSLLFERWRLSKYLPLVWLVSAAPYGFVGMAQSYWQLLICHWIACVGMAGWFPAHGALLKRFYPDRLRGRAYAVLTIVGLCSSMLVVWGTGAWLDADPNAVRIYFPLAALAELLAVGWLLWLARHAPAGAGPAGRVRRKWRTVVRPIWRMGAVLRADPVFFRYELAFMTYGVAFMFCDALLPVLATTRLGMSYGDFSHSTQMVVKTATLLVTLPMGWFHDRMGPSRTCALGFGVLAFYPLGLLLARDVPGVALASVFFGLGLAGVQFGWTLGPVALARRPARVPQYSAIHATLVGLRGVVFQGVGMALYRISGGFTAPLVLAVLAFCAASWQMWHLRDAIAAARHGMTAQAGPAKATS